VSCTCGQNAACNPIEGGWACACPQGFVGDPNSNSINPCRPSSPSIVLVLRGTFTIPISFQATLNNSFSYSNEYSQTQSQVTSLLDHILQLVTGYIPYSANLTNFNPSGEGITTIFLSSFNKSSIISIEAQTLNGSIASKTYNATLIYCQTHPISSILNQSFNCDPKNSFFTFSSVSMCTSGAYSQTQLCPYKNTYCIENTLSASTNLTYLCLCQSGYVANGSVSNDTFYSDLCVVPSTSSTSDSVTKSGGGEIVTITTATDSELVTILVVCYCIAIAVGIFGLALLICNAVLLRLTWHVPTHEPTAAQLFSAKQI
jgi:hypothetical protein